MDKPEAAECKMENQLPLAPDCLLLPWLQPSQQTAESEAIN